jgi:hypothetical protein
MVTTRGPIQIGEDIMTRLHSCLCLAAFAAAAGLLSACDSGPKPPEERTIRGQAVVEKASDGTITAIRVKAVKRSRVYNIDVDEKGKQLADMVGRDLVITGMYERRNDERWMTVKEVKEEGAEDEKKAPEEKKPAEDEKAPEQDAPEEGAPEEKSAPEGVMPLEETKAPEEK